MENKMNFPTIKYKRNILKSSEVSLRNIIIFLNFYLILYDFCFVIVDYFYENKLMRFYISNKFIDKKFK